jgi:hypothetical protein
VKRVFILAAISTLTITLLQLWRAATNLCSSGVVAHSTSLQKNPPETNTHTQLNSSKSNIYRVVYDKGVVAENQASLLPAQLNREWNLGLLTDAASPQERLVAAHRCWALPDACLVGPNF